MDLRDTLFQLINLRSFSSLWYWIALAVVWSQASHSVLGVPFDLVLRARSHGGEAEADLAQMVHVTTGRLARIAHQNGLVLVVLGSGMLSLLAVLGFGYGVEFCQALLLVVLPLALVAVMTLRTAAALAVAPLAGEALIRRLSRHRLRTQVIGVVAIFMTARWGMWQNLRLGGIG